MGNSFAICGFLLFAVTALHGATRVWVGADGANWSDASSWDGGVPTAVDNVSVTNDAHIVVDVDSSAEAPAASNMVIKTGVSVTISGGHTLYLYNGATNTSVSAKTKKLVDENASLEVTGSGTRFYAMSYLPNSEQNDSEVKGDLAATKGAYIEINAIRIFKPASLSAEGADADGVRSRIVFGAGSGRGPDDGSSFTADGGDLIWRKYADAKRYWNFNNGYKPVVRVRNGGTNDMTDVTFNHYGALDAVVESGGVLVVDTLPNHNEYGKTPWYSTIVLSNGTMRARGVPGYYDYSQVYFTFAGDTPYLSVNGLELGSPGAKEYKGGDPGFADVTLAPTPAWTNNDCIIDCTNAANQVNLGTNLIFRLDVDGLKVWADIDGGTLVLPVFRAARQERAGSRSIKPNASMLVDGRWPVTNIVGRQAERYAASFGYREGDDEYRFFDLTVTKRRKTSLTIRLR